MPAETELNCFDEAFYRRWTDRLPTLANEIDAPPWLAEVCDGCGRVADRLSGSAPVVVHGELFTSNALVHRREIYFIDWETAATGAGELDLAALTVGGWSVGTVSAAERAYVEARFGDRPPAGFAELLAAARVYVLLELLASWLEDAPDRLPSSSDSWVFEQLRRAANRVGILP
jgi:aminoglycoside phosphotransferase (APT) family kinase protein